MAPGKKAIKQLIGKVAQDLGDGATQERLFAQKTAFAAFARVQSDRQRLRRPHRMIAVGAIALAAASLLCFVIFNGDATNAAFKVGPLMTPGVTGQWVTTSADESAFRFETGSHIILRSETRARVASTSAEQVHLELTRGIVEANIVGNGHTRWVMTAGKWRITVLGTHFSVLWQEAGEMLDVTVFRGKVRVESPDDTQTRLIVSGGNRFRVRGHEQALSRVEQHQGAETGAAADPVRTTASDHPSPDDAPAVPVSQGATTDQSVPDRRSAAGPARNDAVAAPRILSRDWLVHYANGNYRSAIIIARKYGMDTLIEDLNATELWKLQDAARITRETELSARILHRFRERFPENANARVAGFLLGRIAMDKNRYSSAARWFNTYIAEDPRGPLSEEAHGLLIVVYEKAGQLELATQAAHNYLNRYEDGAFAKIAKGQFNRPDPVSAHPSR